MEIPGTRVFPHGFTSLPEHDHLQQDGAKQVMGFQNVLRDWLDTASRVYTLSIDVHVVPDLGSFTHIVCTK